MGILKGVFFVALCIQFGCIPSYLKKYGAPPVAPPEPQVESKANPKPSAPPQYVTIQQVSDHKVVYGKGFEKIWQVCLDLLLSDYNISTLDRSSGLVTTEWDALYLKGKVFRNRLSLLISKVGNGRTSVKIHNNIEVLRNQESEIWAPAPDDSEEVERIFKNIALALGTPEKAVHAAFDKGQMNL